MNACGSRSRAACGLDVDVVMTAWVKAEAATKSVKDHVVVPLSYGCAILLGDATRCLSALSIDQKPHVPRRPPQARVLVDGMRPRARARGVMARNARSS